MSYNWVPVAHSTTLRISKWEKISGLNTNTHARTWWFFDQENYRTWYWQISHQFFFFWKMINFCRGCLFLAFTFALVAIRNQLHSSSVWLHLFEIIYLNVAAFVFGRSMVHIPVKPVSNHCVCLTNCDRIKLEIN